jgi:UDP-N-acetylglucosamine 4-epimerase
MKNKILYNIPYHDIDLSKYTFLITGGAGFIGSNIAEYLIKFNAKKVRVVDNLSNGSLSNLENISGMSNFEFIEGDIRNLEFCKNVINEIDFISHQAALGSVQRSINIPNETNDVNIGGFLNMLNAAKDSKNVKNFVYASSSSVYGDIESSPKIEGNEGELKSPYAVTKFVNELYAKQFHNLYNFNTIGLRYFNVFGPRQDPFSSYSAVIPNFCIKMINKEEPIIFGDGETTRDFTFVENIVQANIKSLCYKNNKTNMILNIGNGETISLNNLVIKINNILLEEIKPIYLPERIGDIKHSLASINKARKIIKYDPRFDFYSGLESTIYYYKNLYNAKT